MNEQDQARRLAEWLEDPALGVPDEVDPDVVEAVLALRPDLAPAATVSLDEILGGVRTGPMASPASVVLPAEAVRLPPPANVSGARWWWGAVGGVAAAALVLLVISPAALEQAHVASHKGAPFVEVAPQPAPVSQPAADARAGAVDLGAALEAPPVDALAEGDAAGVRDKEQQQGPSRLDAPPPPSPAKLEQKRDLAEGGEVGSEVGSVVGGLVGGRAAGAPGASVGARGSAGSAQATVPSPVARSSESVPASAATRSMTEPSPPVPPAEAAAVTADDGVVVDALEAEDLPRSGDAKSGAEPTGRSDRLARSESGRARAPGVGEKGAELGDEAWDDAGQAAQDVELLKKSKDSDAFNESPPAPEPELAEEESAAPLREVSPSPFGDLGLPPAGVDRLDSLMARADALMAAGQFVDAATLCARQLQHPTSRVVQTFALCAARAAVAAGDPETALSYIAHGLSRGRSTPEAASLEALRQSVEATQSVYRQQLELDATEPATPPPRR